MTDNAAASRVMMGQHGMDPFIIGPKTVRSLLSYEDCIPLMREAMIALARGETHQALRQIIDLNEGRLFGGMIGAISQASGAKLISVMPPRGSGAHGSHVGVVVLFDPETGGPVALIEAGALTAIRTAAASAAATQTLANPDASRLAILGTGDQACAHAIAISHVRDLDEVFIWGRSFDKAQALAARLKAELRIQARATSTAQEAVRNADMICTVTAAATPILESAWAADGAHVNVVGSSRAGPREIDDALVQRSLYFPDHREGVLTQGSEYLHAKAAGLVDETHVQAEIGAVMSGAAPGRLRSNDVTIYKSLGAIAQDLVAG